MTMKIVKYIEGYRIEIQSHNFNDDYFEVDELIAPTVQVLNQKGYLTYICCSGHPFLEKFIYIPYQSNFNTEDNKIVSYIAFKPEIYLPDVQPPPHFRIYKRFLEWTNFEHIYISRKYDDGNVYKILREIVESMEQLHEWALNLPNFDSIANDEEN